MQHNCKEVFFACMWECAFNGSRKRRRGRNAHVCCSMLILLLFHENWGIAFVFSPPSLLFPFLPVAKPSGHRTVRVVVADGVGGGLVCNMRGCEIHSLSRFLGALKEVFLKTFSNFTSLGLQVFEQSLFLFGFRIEGGNHSSPGKKRTPFPLFTQCKGRFLDFFFFAIVFSTPQ